MALQVRRGTSGERLAGFVPATGELILDTSDNTLYIGDGVTVGGQPAGAAKYLGEIKDVNATFNGALNMSQVEVASGILTVTFLSAHGLAPGDEIILISSSHPEITGTYDIATVPTTTTFTVTGLISDFVATADSGSVTKTGYAHQSGAYMIYNAVTGEWDVIEAPGTNGSALVFNTTTRVWEATEYKLAQMKDVDITTTPIANGDVLVYNAGGNEFIPGSAGSSIGRGDGGSFTIPQKHAFVFNVYGAGDFATGGVDLPTEMNTGLVDGGVF